MQIKTALSHHGYPNVLVRQCGAAVVGVIKGPFRPHSIAIDALVIPHWLQGSGATAAQAQFPRQAPIEPRSLVSKLSMLLTAALGRSKTSWSLIGGDELKSEGLGAPLKLGTFRAYDPNTAEGAVEMRPLRTLLTEALNQKCRRIAIVCDFGEDDFKAGLIGVAAEAFRQRHAPRKRPVAAWVPAFDDMFVSQKAREMMDKIPLGGEAYVADRDEVGASLDEVYNAFHEHSVQQHGKILLRASQKAASHFASGHTFHLPPEILLFVGNDSARFEQYGKGTHWPEVV